MYIFILVATIALCDVLGLLTGCERVSLILMLLSELNKQTRPSERRLAIAV